MPAQKHAGLATLVCGGRWGGTRGAAAGAAGVAGAAAGDEAGKMSPVCASRAPLALGVRLARYFRSGLNDSFPPPQFPPPLAPLQQSHSGAPCAVVFRCCDDASQSLHCRCSGDPGPNRRDSELRQMTRKTCELRGSLSLARSLCQLQNFSPPRRTVCTKAAVSEQTMRAGLAVKRSQTTTTVFRGTATLCFRVTLLAGGDGDNLLREADSVAPRVPSTSILNACRQLCIAKVLSRKG